MNSEVIDAQWLDSEVELSLADLAACSGLSEAEVLELVDCGVLAPVVDTPAGRGVFGGHCVVVVRAASRLRDEFELDTPGIALAIGLLERIRGLEAELSELKLLLGPRHPGARQ